MADYPKLGGEGLYRVALADGAYQTPEKIDVLANSTDIVEVEPFIPPDETFLMFYSAGRADNLTPNGMTGDLYIAFRDAEGQWGEPQNLGVPFNSSSEEATPTLSPDGKYLFFASNRDSGKFPDIYWVDFTALQAALPDLENRSGLPLTYTDLMEGFDFTSPVDEAALTPPENAQPPAHTFEGILELFGEQEDVYFEALRGSFTASEATLPEFSYGICPDRGWLSCSCPAGINYYRASLLEHSS